MLDCGWINYNYKHRYLHIYFKVIHYHFWYMSYHTKKRIVYRMIFKIKKHRYSF